MVKAVTVAWYNYIIIGADLTRFGGIETRNEGFYMRNLSGNFLQIIT